MTIPFHVYFLGAFEWDFLPQKMCLRMKLKLNSKSLKKPLQHQSMVMALFMKFFFFHKLLMIRVDYLHTQTFTSCRITILVHNFSMKLNRFSILYSNMITPDISMPSLLKFTPHGSHTQETIVALKIETHPNHFKLFMTQKGSM